jgi:hypothetical protein
MAAQRSFERFNYLLRPNKNVERKLMVEVLAAFEADPRFSLSTYRYVGLSSVYYADAVLFHKRLGISDIVSIEKETSRKKRLEFNRPFSCVKVEPGTTKEALPRLEWTKPQVVWLDYDGGVALEQFADFETLTAKLSSGDFFFVSVNAEVIQLKGFKQDGQELSLEAALRQQVPADAVPPDVQDRLTAVAFPALVGEIWDAYARSKVLGTGRGMHFVPLLNLTYADGARMVTYGGVLVNDDDRARVEALNLGQRFEFAAKLAQFELAVPQLTHKEKLELDRLLPKVGPPAANDLPFELKDTEIEAYWKFYLHYPTYAEFAP